MKTRLREMTPADVPAVKELLRMQNLRDGTSYDIPQVFDVSGSRMWNIPLALVAVTEDGEIRQAHVWEATVEQCTYGIDPEATVCSMKEQDAVTYLLRQRGFSHMHMLVPNSIAPKMAHGLGKIYGMIDTTEHFRHFYRLLDPAENAALRQFYESQEVSA